MKKLIVLMLTFILFFTVFNITPQLKIQIVKADPITIFVPGDYSSIQVAINAATPGDTVFVYNGTYEEIINIDVEGLTIEGQDKESTTIDAIYLGDAVEVSASNVKIKNFAIKNAKDHGVIAENINNMAIENCIIENNGAYGVYLLASSNMISNCEIFENYYSGIKIGGSFYAETNNNAIINCEFYDNGYGGMQDNIMAAVSISPINGIVTNTTIADCLFYESWAYDIYVEGNAVENNMFYHNNFLSKTVTENVYDTCNNIWYNQTLEEGNFWIDYTGKDNDGDRIGDTPYNIPPGGINQDLFPLMDPVGLDRPIADANGPYTANKGVAITFNASGSYDPDEDPEYPYLFYEWDLGNGDTRYGKTVSYTYSSTGLYNVKLTVEDYHGLTDTNTTIATIRGPPNTPSNPNPVNGATDISINADLSWTGGDPDGDPVTYDVYFGTTNNPSKVSSNQSGTTYDPGTMNFSTKYYWKIVAWDNHSAKTVGPLWDFTTVSEPNHPPYEPSNPNPANHSTEIDINENLSWTGGDPDGDTVTYNIYFGTSSNPPLYKSNHNNTSFYPGEMNSNTTYYWKIVSMDKYGATTTGPIWDFTTKYVYQPPYTPYNPNPQNGKTLVSTAQDLHWSGGDPNIEDTVTYDVYFGTNNFLLPKVVSNQSSETYDPGVMNYSTTYYWRIVAWDNHGAFTTGPIWSFTTGSKSTGGNGGGGGPILPSNKVPVANASASDKTGFVNRVVTFNGSYSYDEDGEITNYTWSFGDNNYGYGIITTHIYKKAEVYKVKLTVTDNSGVSNTDSFNIVINQPNNPPNIPQIEGPKTGKQNIEYNFTVFSTDPDNDNIQYAFNWGDNQTTETMFLANGTIFTEQHSWSTAGIFNIKTFAIDSNYESSDSSETNILIDVIYCKNIGYLKDEDSDGIYDLFYSNQTGNITVTERQENGTYLIKNDNDNDSDWDYIYNTKTGTLSAYSSGETKVDNTIFYAIAIVVIIVLLLLVAILGKKPKEEKKIEKEEKEQKQDKAKEKPKKETTKKKQKKSSKKKSTTKKKGKKRK